MRLTAAAVGWYTIQGTQGAGGRERTHDTAPSASSSAPAAAWSASPTVRVSTGGDGKPPNCDGRARTPVCVRDWDALQSEPLMREGGST